MNTGEIIHEAVVTKAGNGSVFVRITDDTGCSGCQAKSVCGLPGQGQKILKIYHPEDNYRKDERVRVHIKQSTGMKAVLISYVLPFFLMIATLITVHQFFPEWVAGISAAGILIPYYIALYLLDEPLKKAFSFSIIKILNDE